MVAGRKAKSSGSTRSLQNIQGTITATIRSLLHSQHCHDYSGTYSQDRKTKMSTRPAQILFLGTSGRPLEQTRSRYYQLINHQHFQKWIAAHTSYTDGLLHGLVGPLGPMASHVLRIRLQNRCGHTWYVLMPIHYTVGCMLTYMNRPYELIISIACVACCIVSLDPVVSQYSTVSFVSSIKFICQFLVSRGSTAVLVVSSE